MERYKKNIYIHTNITGLKDNLILLCTQNLFMQLGIINQNFVCSISLYGQNTFQLNKTIDKTLMKTRSAQK